MGKHFRWCPDFEWKNREGMRRELRGGEGKRKGERESSSDGLRVDNTIMLGFSHLKANFRSKLVARFIGNSVR